jgi:hypothetical protein
MRNRLGLALAAAVLLAGCGSSKTGSQTSSQKTTYAAALRAGYLSSCSRERGKSTSACQCALRKLEASVPEGQFRSESVQALVQASEPSSRVDRQVQAGC